MRELEPIWMCYTCLHEKFSYIDTLSTFLVKQGIPAPQIPLLPIIQGIEYAWSILLWERGDVV